MELCKCGDGLSNSGLPSCLELLSTASGIIMVPYMNSAGSVNAIDLTATLDAAYVTAKLNHVDPTYRWYPIQGIKNVEDLRGDPEFETFNDNSKMRVQDGIRTFKGFKPGVVPSYVGNINDATCDKMGIFIIGVGGELQGSDKVAGFLYPLLISANSWVANYFKPQDKAVSKMMLEFQIDPQENDRNLSYIAQTEFNNYNLLSINGLQDATIENLTVDSATVVSFDVETMYGTAVTKNKVKGLVSADFVSSDSAVVAKVYNEDTAADVTVVAAEPTPGSYTLTFTAQTAGDVIRVKIKKNGFEFEETTFVAL